MELRQPPRPPEPRRSDRLVRWLLVLNLVLVLGLGLLVMRDRGGVGGRAGDAERDREVASKLKAAGALDQAAVLYARYLEQADLEPEARARVAYSLGNTYLREGSLSEALRWFYEAETVGAGALSDELGQRIVNTLERLGRHHAAEAALERQVQLEGDPAQHSADDPVVARIGAEEVLRSDVERALDELPPELASSISGPEQRQEFLRKYVADELLWRKAQKLEYDRDDEVLRRHAMVLKQLAVAKFVEQEVVRKIEVDEEDLRNFYQANLDRYQQPESDGKPAQTPSFDEIRQLVERDYRMSKIQAEYERILDSELATADVELFPQEMGNG